MSGLQAFRIRLSRLRNRRALVRWQTAIARGLVLSVLALFALVLIDYSFRLGTAPRGMVILVFIFALVWQAIRYIGLHLSQDETIIDVALLLERTNSVDSDLVAALQFDSSASKSAGSLELQQAVIDRAVKISKTLDVRSAVAQDDARRATRHAAIAVLAVSVCWLAFPNHASSFWDRLWLGDAKYPTRTQITEIAINGRSGTTHIVAGEPIAFRVECAGVAPDEGIVSLRGIDTGDSTRLILKRLGESNHGAVYTVNGPRLNESVEYSLRIGDAETEPRRIDLIQRPLVELTIEALTPAYMQRETTVQHEHHVEVVEGTAINFSIQCTNGKRLTVARFEMVKDDSSKEEATAFSPTDELGMDWQLDADVSGLLRVVKAFQFRVFVVDEDELSTYHPIEGAVRVKSDRAPEALLESSHHAIMPHARPTITYTAEDDFGIGSLKLHVRRAGMRELEAGQQETVALELPFPETRGPTRQTTVRGEYVLDLSALNLVERDKLLVWIEATDYRGEWPGVSTLSEAIEFDVADERGVLDAILRSDADAEQMLTDVIEKELGLRSK